MAKDVKLGNFSTELLHQVLQWLPASTQLAVVDTRFAKWVHKQAHGWQRREEYQSWLLQEKQQEIAAEIYAEELFWERRDLERAQQQENNY